jgi:hypothetical protein
MYIEFPWLNHYIGSNFSDARDFTPEPFSLFYVNMNLASLYLLAILVAIGLGALGMLIGRLLGSRDGVKIRAYLTILYNLFIFGSAFAGFASLQGIFMNPIPILDLNFTFYIIGVLLYISIVTECMYKLSSNLYKIRAILKATLLSLAYISPVSLLSATILIDLFLAVGEYNLNKYPKEYPKLWVFQNVMANLTLALLGFLPTAISSLLLVTFGILAMLAAEGIMHCLEAHNKVDNNMKKEE